MDYIFAIQEWVLDNALEINFYLLLGITITTVVISFKVINRLMDMISKLAEKVICLSNENIELRSISLLAGEEPNPQPEQL